MDDEYKSLLPYVVPEDGMEGWVKCTHFFVAVAVHPPSRIAVRVRKIPSGNRARLTIGKQVYIIPHDPEREHAILEVRSFAENFIDLVLPGGRYIVTHVSEIAEIVVAPPAEVQCSSDPYAPIRNVYDDDD
jgi:hypothetical protein